MKKQTIWLIIKKTGIYILLIYAIAVLLAVVANFWQFHKQIEALKINNVADGVLYHLINALEEASDWKNIGLSIGQFISFGFFFILSFFTGVAFTGDYFNMSIAFAAIFVIFNESKNYVIKNFFSTTIKTGKAIFTKSEKQLRAEFKILLNEAVQALHRDARIRSNVVLEAKEIIVKYYHNKKASKYATFQGSVNDIATNLSKEIDEVLNYFYEAFGKPNKRIRANIIRLGE